MRKKLIEAGIEIKEQAGDEYKVLKKKIKTMKERGLSYQAIADVFDLWKIPTRSAWAHGMRRQFETFTLILVEALFV